jgi:hypothetical protein
MANILPRLDIGSLCPPTDFADIGKRQKHAILRNQGDWQAAFGIIWHTTAIVSSLSHKIADLIRRKSRIYCNGVPNMTVPDDRKSTVITVTSRGDLIEFTITPFDDQGSGELRRAGAFVGAMAAGAIISCGCQVILKQDRQLESR